MSNADTLYDLLRAGAQEANAIAAPERASLTHAGLARQMDAVIDTLNSHGIGRNDRVAIVLPNGPEMASAFLTIACAATTAPLNPASRASVPRTSLTTLLASVRVLGSRVTVTVAESAPFADVLLTAETKTSFPGGTKAFVT